MSDIFSEVDEELRREQLRKLWEGYGVYLIAACVLLVAAVGGPDVTYPANSPNVNPWRYACPGTSNPDSYDRWMKRSIGGKTYLLCNWSKQVQINSPLP